jgi:hypothetical protein
MVARRRWNSSAISAIGLGLSAAAPGEDYGVFERDVLFVELFQAAGGVGEVALLEAFESAARISGAGFGIRGCG